MHNRRLLALFLLLPAACRAVPAPPPHYVANPYGVVYATDPGTARTWADLVDGAWTGVLDALPGLDERPLDLRIVGELDSGGAHGLTYPTRIEIRSNTPPGSRRFVLAHELVHYLADDTWGTLPHVLQEGLGDWAAMRVDPAEGVRRRAGHVLLTATLAEGGLTIADVDESGLAVRRWRFRTDVDRDALPALASVLELTDDEIVELQGTDDAILIYAVGWLYVERIGVHGLRNLCRRADREGRDTVPAGWIHAAAGFDRYAPAEWAAAARALLGPAERSYLLRRAQETELAAGGDGPPIEATPGEATPGEATPGEATPGAASETTPAGAPRGSFPPRQ